MDSIFETTVICPGCGWTGGMNDLKPDGELSRVCPSCGYENNTGTYRLNTLAEMIMDDGEYNNVRMDLFLMSLSRLVEGGYTDAGQD